MTPEDEAEILEHVLTRSLLKLFPTAYWDIYVPSRVLQLQAERDKVLRTLDEELRRIDDQIQEEHSFFAPFRLSSESRSGGTA